MRIPVVCTVLALGLLSCHRTTAYVNADDFARVPTGSPAAGPCNDLEQQGQDVDLTGSQAPAPRPAGGTILDGTYVLTSSTLHTTDKPHGTKLVRMGKITMLVNGTTSQLVRHSADGRERRTTVNRVSSGTTTTTQTTCAYPSSSESGSTATAAFTATGKALQFITPGPAGTVVATYMKL